MIYALYALAVTLTFCYFYYHTICRMDDEHSLLRIHAERMGRIK